MPDFRYSEPSAWADAFAAADFDALANDAGKLSTASVVANGTGRLLLADVSFIMVTSTVSPTNAPHLALYLLPLLHDGTTYVDNEDSATVANQPSPAYLAGTIAFRTKATQSIAGIATGLVVPPGTFRWYGINRNMNGTSSLPASSTNMTCRYRLYGYESA
jgi:hypothetical protein